MLRREQDEAVEDACGRQSEWKAVRTAKLAPLQPSGLPSSRRIEAAATRFDCRLSQEILDGGNGWRAGARHVAGT
jgi:hypothetical protein